MIIKEIKVKYRHRINDKTKKKNKDNCRNKYDNK